LRQPSRVMPQCMSSPSTGKRYGHEPTWICSSTPVSFGFVYIYQRKTAHTERLCDSAGGAECAPCNELVCWWERRIDGEDETPGWGAGAAGN
jgi:hypothetical protein